MRILWPFTLQCVTADVLPADNYPKALEMVHGNVLLYSWWVDIYRAFHGSDYERVSMLLECALCVTVNLQLLPRRRSGLIARYIWAASDTREMSDVLAIPCHVFAFKGRIPNRRAAGRYKVVPEEDLGGSPGRLQGGAAEVSGQGLEQASQALSQVRGQVLVFDFPNGGVRCFRTVVGSTKWRRQWLGMSKIRRTQTTCSRLCFV